MATETILNNYGILECIVGFLGKTDMCLISNIPSQTTNFLYIHLFCTHHICTSTIDCKSMVQLSLACKQLSSDVNKNALSMLKQTDFARQYEVITVFDENHRIKLTRSVTKFVRGYTTTVFEELNELRTRKRLKKLLVTLVRRKK